MLVALSEKLPLLSVSASGESMSRKYHLPGFEASIKNNVSSIMPYYAKPAQMKSAKQYDMNGNEITWTPVGFAFNEYFIQDLLRKFYEMFIVNS